jgi:hypothetical protein
MSPLAWAVIVGVTVVIELFLAWRIVTAFGRGTVMIDPLFWVADWLGFEFTVSRARSPIFYWAGVLFLMACFAIVLALFVTIAVINMKGQ